MPEQLRRGADLHGQGAWPGVLSGLSVIFAQFCWFWVVFRYQIGL